jgi:uncharacterized protein YbjQ (UPF0145 family)
MEFILLFSIYILPPLLLILLGLVAGKIAEQNHLRSLARREAGLREMLVTDVRSYDPAVDRSQPSTLVVAEAIISTDYLKSFFARLRNIFGGEVRSFLTLVQRSRREALLRIMEQARDKGYNAVCNVRLETADIGLSTGAGAQRGATMSAIIASGTAYRRGISEHPYRGSVG